MNHTARFYLVVLVLAALPISGRAQSYAYATNAQSNDVSAYAINSSTGALTAVPGSPFPAGAAPHGITVSPLGDFVYVANQGSTTVSAFTINGTSGALTAVPGSPFFSGSNPVSVAGDPSGDFLYVANAGGTISAFAIDASAGALTPILGSPFAVPSANPYWVTVDPLGRFVYVVSLHGGVTSYTLDSGTGALTLVPGSPFTTGLSPVVATVHPSGNFVYTGNQSDDTISAFAVDSTTGALSPVPGSPFATGPNPASIDMDPAGNFLYVGNNFSDTISVYAINKSTGALSSVGGSPFLVPGFLQSLGVTADRSGHFLYVADASSNTLSAFTVNIATGALTPVPGSPFAAGSYPLSIATGATNANSSLLVANLSDASIKRFDGTTGAFIGTMVAPHAGGLQAPTFFIRGPDGNLYVTDCGSGSRAVKRYNGSTGAYIDDFLPAGSGSCYGLAFGPDGNFYAMALANVGSSGIKRYNGSTGAYMDDFVPGGSGGLSYPQGFVFGPDGNLYVADQSAYTVGTTPAIRRYNGTTGAFIDNFVPIGPPDSDPISVRFGPDGNLYVSMFYSHTINRYNGTTGASMGTFVPAGSGGLNYPVDVVFGPDSNLYTNARYSGAVQRYDGSTGASLGNFVAPGSGGLSETFGLLWIPNSNSAPAVILSSSNLTFSNQNVGTTSANQSVTLTNTGNATLNLSSLSASGDFTLAVTGTSCPYSGGTVGAGMNCTIDVAFTPTATGARAGTVTITDNVSGSPQIVNLSGTGVAPAVSLSAATLAFGNQVTHTTSAAKPVTLTNTGSGVLSISSASITGTNSGDYTISANTCGPTVVPGGICAVSVTFTPTIAGARPAAILFADDANTSPQSVSLTGNGLDPLAVSPATLAFGKEGTGTASAAKNITLRNNTSAIVTITGTSITGTNATEFAQVATTCGSTLAAHSSCTTSVTFGAVVTGTASATLTVADSAANSPQSVNLTGTGVQPVTLSVAALNFGNQGIASPSSPKNVTLTNNNSDPLIFTGMTISGTNSADYAESAATCGSSLAGHSSCVISMTFTPSVVGAETAALSVADDAGNTPQTVALTGVGVEQLSLSATALSYGNQVINTTSAAKNVTLKNNTSAALAITGTTFTGPNATEFGPAGTTCGSTLAAHSTCILGVAYSPAATGVESATLTITDSANNSPQTVALTGTGIVPVSLTPAALTFATLKVGNSSTAKTIILKNNQSITLNISGIATGGVNAGDFSQSATTCGSTLAPNASCSVSILFTPTAVGGRAASLNVTDDASTSPQLATLFGTGK